MEPNPGWLQPLFATAFTLWETPQTWLELIAFVLAIAMVFCNMRVHPVAWPLAIASSALYGLLFWHLRLYGSAALQALFIAVAFWGWWEWLRGRQADGGRLRVRHLGGRGRAVAAGCALAGWPMVAYYLARHTDSPVPWFDAFPTSVSVVGQWLLGRKYVENWLAWIVANLAGTALYASQALWLTTALYALLLVLAVAGWRVWAAKAGDAGIERTG